MYCTRTLLANCSKSPKSCCLIWLSFVTGFGMNLSAWASNFIRLSIKCLFGRFLMCFLLASNCALFLLLLRLCLRILFEILFPLSLGLRLRYSGNKPVYFSTCLFVISCNFANISLRWPWFSIKPWAILYTFVVSTLRLDSYSTTLLFLAVTLESFCFLLRCSSLLRLMICLWWKRERELIKSSFPRLRMRLTSFLNYSSALALARALYRKNAGQVPLSECLFRISIAFWAFLIRSSAGNVGASLWRRLFGLSLWVVLAGCFFCLLVSPHFSFSFRSLSGLISLFSYLSTSSSPKVTSSSVSIILLVACIWLKALGHDLLLHC